MFMKYLKVFEGVREAINKLQSYCEDNLSYLIDNGFVVRVNMNRGNFYKNESDYYVINIFMINSDGDNPFKWEDVMYDIIPFIIQLDKEFIIKPLYRRDGIIEINPVIFDPSLGKNIFYSLEQLTDVNNEFKELNNELIYSLRIHISKQSPKLRYLRK